VVAKEKPVSGLVDGRRSFCAEVERMTSVLAFCKVVA
jgi:hypothetical protein